MSLSLFTTEQKELIKQLLSEVGLEYKEKDSYVFSDGSKKKTLKTVYEKINLGEMLGEHPELQDKALAFYQNKFPDSEFKSIVEEYCSENAPSDLDFSSLDYKGVLGLEESEQEGLKEYVSTLMPLVDMSKNAKERIILVDPTNENRPATNVAFEVYMALTGVKMGEILSSREIPAVYPTYNPFIREAIFKDFNSEGRRVPYVNYYIPPKWTRVEVKPAYRGKIKALIEHLFEDEKEREQVLDWMHYAIAKKAGTILCLAGSRGIGKTLLISNLLTPLLGGSNAEIVNSEILEEKFNSAFKHKRLLVFEEVQITTDKALNKFKAFCNDRIAVEEKGRDSETITSYVSMAVMLNNIGQLRVMPQERRFSIPWVTSKPLTDSISAEDITEFVEEMKDPESKELAEFGHWLMERVPARSELEPIKGKYYFKVSASNMEDWKIFLVDYLASLSDEKAEEGISFKNIKKEFRRSRQDDKILFPTKPTLVNDFFEDFLYDGEYHLAKVVPSEERRGTFKVVPNKDFIEMARAKIARGEKLIDYDLSSYRKEEEMQGGDEENLL